MSLQSYAPLNVSVLHTGNTTLLAADSEKKLKSVILTNTHATYAVWVCHANETAVLLKGWYLEPNGGHAKFEGDDVPHDGLNAISTTGTAVVAVARA